MFNEDNEKTTLERLDAFFILDADYNNNNGGKLKAEILKNQQWYFIKFQTFCKISKPNKSELARYYDPYYVLAEV